MTAMPAPAHMDGIGNSHLQITTKSAEAQAYFDQGLNLLHCFWDYEAWRAFKEAARLDPDSAMAYWGIVESTKDYDAMEDDRVEALEKAEALLPNITEHERFYIRAARKQEDAGDSDKDKKPYVKEMEALIADYPGDIDARLFLSLSIMGDQKLYSQQILRNLLHEHPDSAAVNHYWIHAAEGTTRPEDALHSADVLGSLASSSGHMVHMPGHIYYRTGDYERARECFRASKATDEGYMKAQKVSTADDWNYPHNLSYLIAAEAEAGRYQEALATAATLQKIPANPFRARNSPNYVLTVGGSLVRLHLRFGRWQAAVDHPIDIGMSPDDAGSAAVAYRDGMLAYAKGMVALERDALSDAAAQSDALDSIQWRLHAEGKDDDEEKGNDPNPVLGVLEVASLDLRGNLRAREGKLDEAVRLLKKAVEKEKDTGYREPPQCSRPELESLGHVYLRARDWDHARETFEQELKQRPKSGFALRGVAMAYEGAGKTAEAERAREEFKRAWAHADADLQ